MNPNNINSNGFYVIEPKDFLEQFENIIKSDSRDSKTNFRFILSDRKPI